MHSKKKTKVSTGGGSVSAKNALELGGGSAKPKSLDRQVLEKAASYAYDNFYQMAYPTPDDSASTPFFVDLYPVRGTLSAWDLYLGHLVTGLKLLSHGLMLLSSTGPYCRTT